MYVTSSMLRSPACRPHLQKKCSFVRAAFVVLGLLALYQIAVTVRQRDRLAQLRALEYAYRALETPSDGVPDHRTDWREVAGAEGRIYTYTAYIDPRLASIPQVRVLVLAPIEGESFVECSFWTRSNQSSTVAGKLMILPEHHKRPLSSGVIDCPLDEYFLAPLSAAKNSNTNNSRITARLKDEEMWSHSADGAGLVSRPDPVVRVTVSTVPGNSRNYAASLPVDVLVNRLQRGKLNVCVKQIHSGYNGASRLVEFIELQKILGADHFTFYNLSIGPDVDKVFQHYAKEGLVDVMPFTAPDPSTVDNIDRVTIASLNDCVLRSVGRYSLVAISDVDEIIIPREMDSNLKMVQELGHFAEYGVQNAFFYLFYEDDSGGKVSSQTSTGVGAQCDAVSVDDGKEFLLTQRKTRRVARPYPHTIRSKYICRPEEILIPGIHAVHEMTEGARVLRLNSLTALSHHYRSDCVENCDRICDEIQTVVDRSAHRFKDPLISAVITSCRAIFPARHACLPPPVQPVLQP